MYKTLADMTPEQRAECVGMWCYIFEQLDEPPVAEGIIAGYRENDDGRTLVIIDHPHPDAGKWGHGLTEVVPRPDLSRAWQPDGQPVPGEWETYREVGIGETFLREERRWGGKWEQA